MRSVIAEAHFDGSRNAVVEIGGLRRWILAHPDQCKSMHMLPESHPSGRHSAVDWSKPDLKAYPNFSKVVGNEVILQPGDFLFVPTFWIHYIVSLNINFQCNSRSGIHQPYAKYIQECGF
jgi:ribosomal protein L16 Arg81 hydroxylase